MRKLKTNFTSPMITKLGAVYTSTYAFIHVNPANDKLYLYTEVLSCAKLEGKWNYSIDQHAELEDQHNGKLRKRTYKVKSYHEPDYKGGFRRIFPQLERLGFVFIGEVEKVRRR